MIVIFLSLVVDVLPRQPDRREKNPTHKQPRDKDYRSSKIMVRSPALVGRSWFSPMWMACVSILAFQADGFALQPAGTGVPPFTPQMRAVARSAPAASWSRQLPSTVDAKRSAFSTTTAIGAAVVSTNQELLPGIEAINAANDDLYDKLQQIRDEPYFRLYSVDILASCEYLPQELFECYTESCEIYPVDEDEVRDWVVHCRAPIDSTHLAWLHGYYTSWFGFLYKTIRHL